MNFFLKCFKVLLISVFTISLYSPALAQINNKFSFQFSDGLTYLTIGGLNHHNIDWNKTRERSVEAAGGTVISESQELHWGGELNGKLRYKLMPKLALCIGIGFIHGQLLDDIAETRTGENTALIIHDLKVRALPIGLGVQYIFPVTSRTNISIETGVDYYYASFDKFYRREPGDCYWIDNHFTGSGNGLGVNGGLSFEYNVSKNASIFIMGRGRYANISGINGSRGRVDSNDWSDFVDGTFYEFEREREEGIWSKIFNISLEEPSGDNIRKVKDAALDFSGFNVMLGVNFGIF